MKTATLRDCWLGRRLTGELLESRHLLSAVGFVTHDIVSSDATGSVYAVDLDGDGDTDVLSASTHRLGWYENTDGKGTFAPQQLISPGFLFWWVHSADVDGDGDVDVLSAADSGLTWHENTDGHGTFGPQQEIGHPDHFAAVKTADLDGDGDLDVLHGLWWYENTNGKGTFGPRQMIPDDAARSGYAADLDLADLDGDGHVDVLSVWSPFNFSGDSDDRKVAWYENTDGKGTFSAERFIITDVGDADSVLAADVDGDGDTDLLTASRTDGKIAWYENSDGDSTFESPQVITTDAVGAKSVFAADVDGDGDVDVLSASSLFNIFDPETIDGKIAWYENTDGEGTFGPQLIINTEPVFGANSVFAADVDGDGDVDVLSASSLFNFDPETRIRVSQGKIAWYESRLAGDADDDGEVNFADALTLADNFAKTNGVWEDGDFNGDGRVNFSDFLILANNFGESRLPLVALP